MPRPFPKSIDRHVQNAGDCNFGSVCGQTKDPDDCWHFTGKRGDALAIFAPEVD
ncbi:MAG: hypothetical protein M3430_09790 [Acidobacteriota bacterium]|nr:hypothetical protein [Acidobacteriota bacterium]